MPPRRKYTVRQSIHAVKEQIHPKNFYVTSPEMATVGERLRADFQRFLAIALGITCISLGIYNRFGDCRLFIHFPADNSNGTSTNPVAFSNFTEQVDDFLTSFGIDNFDVDMSLFDDCIVGDLGDRDDCDAIAVSQGRGTLLWFDEDDRIANEYQCQHWDRFAYANDHPELQEILKNSTPRELRFWHAIDGLSVTSIVCGILGVVCALVETCCIVCYPTIIAGAILFAMAGTIDFIEIFLQTLAYRRAFVEDRCVYGNNFYTYLFVICAYCFASCLLVLGIRAYPWCLRKNRDPKNCPVVNPEILSEEDPLPRLAAQSKRALIKFADETDSEPQAPQTLEAASSNDENILLDTCVRIETELFEVTKKLASTEAERDEALARAESAEARLRAYEHENPEPP